MSDSKSKTTPEKVFLQHGGQLRMSEVIKHGISRYTLYKMNERVRLVNQLSVQTEST